MENDTRRIRRLLATILAITALALATGGVGLADVPGADTPTAEDVQAQASAMDFYPTADASVYEVNPTLAAGASVDLQVGYNFRKQTWTLVRFNLAALPSNAVVTGATLTLQFQFNAPPGEALAATYNVHAYRITNNWSEASVTWNGKPGYITQGGSVTAVPDTGTSTSLNVTAIAQSWVNGGTTNYGILLRGDGVEVGTRTFRSRETAGDPMLRIFYSLSSATSTPTRTATATRTRTPTATRTRTPTLTPPATPDQINCLGLATLEASEDAYISQSHPDNNYGGGTNLFLGAANGRWDTFLYFPVDRIAPGKYIYAATIEMTVESEANASKTRLTVVHPALSAWSEGTITYNNAPNGGGMVGTYYHDPGQSVVRWDITPLFRQWYSGEVENHGVMILGASGLATYYSRESGQGPRLVIECGPAPYTSTPTPQPTWTSAPTATETPITPTPVPLVFTIDTWEITQGLQTQYQPMVGMPNMPIIAYKPTFVRLTGHATRNGQMVDVGPQEFAVKLTVDRPGETNYPPYLIPKAATKRLYATGPNREQAMLFEIPQGWTDPGQVTLTFTMGSSFTSADRVERTTTLTFGTTNPICVVYVPVRTGAGSPPGDYMVNTPDGWAMEDRAASLWPVSDLTSYYMTEPIEKIDWWGIIPVGYTGYNPDSDGGITTIIADRDLIMISLWERDRFSDDPDWCDDRDARTHYVGMVKPDGLTSNGYGASCLDQLWFVMRMDVGTLYNGAAIGNPRGGRNLAHELGHNYCRDHIDCNDPDDPDLGFPWDPCHFAEDLPGDPPDEYWGFDPITQMSIPASANVAPLMSYGDPRWPSIYTWEAEYDWLTGNAPWPWSLDPSRAAAQAVPAEIMLIAGVIPSADRAVLHTVAHLPSNLIPRDKLQELLSQTLTDVGDYALRLVDRGGRTLSEQSFAPIRFTGEAPLHDGQITQPFFGFAVPYVANTAGVQVVRTRDGTVMAEREASANAPRVQVLSPNGGERLGRTATITWKSTDGDGDPLLYTVQYSPDMGVSWRTLATNHITTTLTVETKTLPAAAGTGLVRVIATDGLLTDSDTSDAGFTVPMHAPEVTILAPSGTVFSPDEPIILYGKAMDAEDFAIDPAFMRWSVSILGEVGNGEQLYLTELPVGKYLVTLEATDSDRQTGSDSITIYVQERVDLYLPMLLRP